MIVYTVLIFVPLLTDGTFFVPIFRKDYEIYMKTINGHYTSATIFTTKDNETAMDDYALCQIKMLCDNRTFQDCKIRIMPDVHPGKVGTIGFTSTIKNMIMPNVVGVDIGCGITIAKIKTSNIAFQKADSVIRERIPSGFSIRKKPHRFSQEFDFSKLHCQKYIHKEKALNSLGTLGGGNHFIEFDQSTDNHFYITIHTGSRHLGKEVTEYYLTKGQEYLKSRNIEVPYELTFLEGELLEKYFHDVQIVQDFAWQNRMAILDELAKGMKWKITETISCIHNYIDFSGKEPVLRKGAISAKEKEPVIIPINMRDGVLLGFGLGNQDWNCSAPHGAGRIIKRSDVKNHYTVSAFKKEMKGIYSTCIGKDTLDESPFAYRSISEISDAIKDTVKITDRLVPVYNFKSGNKR